MQSYKDNNGMLAVKGVTPLGRKTLDMTLNPMITEIPVKRFRLTPEFWASVSSCSLGQAMDELCPESRGRMRFIEGGSLVVTEDLDVPDDGTTGTDNSVY